MALQIGDIVPNFTAKDNYGNDFDSKDYLGKKTLVIYFYPKNDTRVCTEQACSFSDNYEDFKALGAEVIGVSSDTIDSHQQFSEKHKLPFILLSDSSSSFFTLSVSSISNRFLTYLIEESFSVTF